MSKVWSIFTTLESLVDQICTIIEMINPGLLDLLRKQERRMFAKQFDARNFSDHP